MLSDIALANMFLSEQHAVGPEQIYEEVRQWLIRKYSESAAKVQAKKSFNVPVLQFDEQELEQWQSALGHENAITELVRPIVVERLAGTVTDMNLAEYAENRARLGVKNEISYEW